MAGVNNVPAQASRLHSLCGGVNICDQMKISRLRQQKADGDDRKRRAQVDSHRGSVIIHEVVVSAPCQRRGRRQNKHTLQKNQTTILHILPSEERMWLITWSVTRSFAATCVSGRNSCTILPTSPVRFDTLLCLWMRLGSVEEVSGGTVY